MTRILYHAPRAADEACHATAQDGRPVHAGKQRRNPSVSDLARGAGRLASCATTRQGRMMATVALLAGLGGVTVGGAPTVSAQEVRGLVIGINDYVELRDLAGAVNDARDVAKALSGAGVDDVVVLEDAAATRERIATEWRALMARSDPGGTLVLTYAGHGGQEQARTPGTEEDGLDEVLLLGGFTNAGLGTRERIFDDELNQWFVEADERELRVIFVADSCHSGSLTRSIDPRAPSTASRYARYTVTDDMLELDFSAETAALEHADLPHLSFLAAGQEHQEVLEVVLPDEAGRPEPRGALSYHFARALEGDADFDRDGMLRRDELWRFVRENVRMKSHSRQLPNLIPASDDSLLLRLSPPPAPRTDESNAESGAAVLVAQAPETPSTPTPEPAGATKGTGTTVTGASTHFEESESLRTVRLTVLNGDPATLAILHGTLDGVRLVTRENSPDIVWDAETRQVISGLGDVVAYDVDPATLPAVVDKWRAVRVIQDLSTRASLQLRVTPDDKAHYDGTEIEVEVGGLRSPALILLGLSGNGVVHYLSHPSDSARIAPGRPFSLRLEVGEPFGADHIVAVSAASSLDWLHVELERLDDEPAAGRVVELLVAASTEATDWWSGIQGLFSVP